MGHDCDGGRHSIAVTLTRCLPRPRDARDVKVWPPSASSSCRSTLLGSDALRTDGAPSFRLFPTTNIVFSGFYIGAVLGAFRGFLLGSVVVDTKEIR